ncbi:MAG: peptide deformylase [Spirochaetes bacterium GWF1_49_6]|nr:MAG: peptide deformylase [Spirochaetes bacterium GWF1_49_6]
MAVLKMRTYGDPVLRKRAEDVSELNDEILRYIIDLEDTLGKQNGVGLAAPQVGISKRIFVIDLRPSKEDKRIALINPEIIDRSSNVIEREEGCLSVPEVWGSVIRPESIKIKGMLPNGRIVTIRAEGLYARALQHEFDHLEGVLFIDYLSTGELDKNRDLIDQIIDKNRKKLERIQI